MNTINYKLVLPALLLLLITIAADAQQLKVIDSLQNKISLYGIKNQLPTLFIHFDKTIYSNNENVWFTSYLLNCADRSAYKTLSLMLVRDDDHVIVMDDKFAIKNGFAFGNTFIPNAVGPGNYTFIAYTNHVVNESIDVVFKQPVTIKMGDASGINASLNPIDTSTTAATKKVLLLVNFTNETVQPATIPVSYYVGNGLFPVLKGVVATKAGQYEFNIPAELLTQGSNSLHVQIIYKTDVKDINMTLPITPGPAIVRFYPEGGNLVNNLQSTVGWEVKNSAGAALGVNAVLYEDKKIIDTIETGAYGLGKFRLKPKAGSTYYVKLYRVNKKDTLYKLPVAITQGPILSLPNAIVNDTLIVNLRDAQHEKLYLLGHNYKQVFFTMPVIMNTVDKTVTIKLNDIPKGLTQLTLVDSLGRPFAERIFFAHYNHKTLLSILADKDEYGAREKVNVKIKLDGKPDTGFVSIACVQENRIETRKKSDIESYLYLRNDLEDIPARALYLGNSKDDKQYLEDVLLVKGWRKYTWASMLKTQPADTLHNFNDITFKGNVTWYSDRLIKPVTLININKPQNTFVTSRTGYFLLNDTDLITDPNRKVGFIVGGNNVKNYHVYLLDPYIKINKLLAGLFKPGNYDIPEQINTQYMQLPDNEHAVHLKEVKINGGKEAVFHANACGDYVCWYNVLNCPNHRNSSDNRPPVVGEKYYMDLSGKTGVYTGCGGISEHQFKGIYQAVEFYPSDYSKGSPATPEYLSTIYWRHQLKISAAKAAEFSFYTSDITGRFKIVVQGVTGNDVTYGEKTFNVVKAK